MLQKPFKLLLQTKLETNDSRWTRLTFVRINDLNWWNSYKVKTNIEHEVIIISDSQLFLDEEIYEIAASERIMKTKSYLSNGAKILRHCRIASIYFATFLRTQSTLHLEIQYLFVDTKKAIFFLSQNYFVVLLCLNFIWCWEEVLNFVK